jgi:hypothetical protein
MRNRNMGDNVIILPRAKIAHVAPGCSHWVCVGATAAMINDIEVCAMCAASVTAEHKALARHGDGQQHD